MRLAVTLVFLLIAQFLAYRNSIENLSKVIDEKKQFSVKINELTEQLRTKDEELDHFRQDRTNAQTKPNEVSRIGIQQDPLVPENIQMIAETEHSSHPDAPYAIKLTLQTNIPINPVHLAVVCVDPIKYVEYTYPAASTVMWYGAIEVSKNNDRHVIVNMVTQGDAALRPDLPLTLHLSSIKPIVVKELIRGPK